MQTLVTFKAAVISRTTVIYKKKCSYLPCVKGSQFSKFIFIK
jgi:hypothetical protein